LSDIEGGLQHLEQNYRAWGIESLAMPPLGCGNGQLDWRIVGPVLYRHLERFDIPVTLFAPSDAPAEQIERGFLQASEGGQQSASNIEPVWIGLIRILDCIEQERYRPAIGRVALQKIAYFATQAGLPTGLQYKRSSYGPFSSELKRQLTRLANNGLISEEHIGNAFAVSLGPAYRDAENIVGVQLEGWTDVIERVVDLFMRVRTTHQAEVAATVHFVAEELRSALGEPPTEADVLDAVMDWKINRKPPLRDEEVAETIRSLSMLGWIDVHASEDLPLSDDELTVA
jgi:uncharacterized protein YwgA